MKILVVGKGGREHALITAFHESTSKTELYSFPGSDAIAEIATNVHVDSLEALITWMKDNNIDLCVAGEESYLVKGEGLANLCQQANIPCWGPHKEAAQLEASKQFAKEFMQKHQIPTGASTCCKTIDEASNAIAGNYPTVLKFDGLAAGKGVAVCEDKESADTFLKEVMVEKRFGDGNVLVEEFLEGPELSIFAAVVDNQYLIFTPARDYKRALDDDKGANTGGMGAVASRQLVSEDLLKQIETEIIQPTVNGLVSDKLPYRGFIYFGLMLTKQGPKIIEYNCRFGDPECQAVMPLIKGDLASFCLSGAKGTLTPELLEFSNNWSVCLVRASAGYPESSRSGDVIHGIDSIQHARVYHAGTRNNANNQWETNGGRVLAVVSTGDERLAAVEKAYQELAKITFDGMQSRSDIGVMNF